jgi:diadenosine tetraphosphate (Ap4A) HIT family hydrolase
MPEAQCLFCQHPSEHHRILFETEHFWVRYDNFPVNEGHVEIVSQRHVPDLLSLNDDERQDFWKVLERTIKKINPAYLPDGYNYGVNEGLAAGQTVMHLHVHVIPRYQGDVPEPRGGVRNLKPALVKY